MFHYSDFWKEKYLMRFRDPDAEVYIVDHEFPDPDVTSYIRFDPSVRCGAVRRADRSSVCAGLR